MKKELEALNDLLLLSKLSDGGKKGMSALRRADYNAHIIYRALERAKKVEELLELYRKHMNTLCKNAREGVKDSMFSAEFIAYKLYQQIQALEEELK